MSRATVITATIAMTCLTAGASAITNPGFETGDTSGWTLTLPYGAWAHAVTQHQGDLGTAYTPPEGSYFLLMKTNGPGSYSRAEQVVTLSAGSTLSGWAAFDSQDYVPFNDNASVRILDLSGAVVATPWYADVAIVGDYGDGPWTFWSWIAPNAGTYVLRYEIANSLDSILDSFALFDGGISDSDEDGIDDSTDNCPETPNPNQTDGDADGVGDVCDNCLDIPNSEQGDNDADGVGDCCESDQPDCNANGVPDSCDVTQATSEDCNDNGVPDECDIASESSEDCNGNGIPDECEEDCNGNGIADGCDLAAGTSADCNGNDIPDECDLASGVSDDCQPNGLLDSCDIDLGDSLDCNANVVPDECDIASGASDDCQPNGIPDDCEWAAYLNPVGQGGAAGVSTTSSICQSPDQQEHGGAFIVPLDWELGAVAADSFTFKEATTITSVTWWGAYLDECGEPCDAADDFVLTFYVSDGGPASIVVATYHAGGAPTRSATGQTIPLGPGFAEYEYSFDLVPPLSVAAGQRHWVEIRNDTADSCMWWWETAPEGANGNGTCLYDGDADGYQDSDLAPYDLAFCVYGLPAAQDCNANGVLDAQDIFDNTSQDCQPNGIPDECEDDRNYNGVPDTCDIVSGVSKDLNFNSVPDEADCLTTPGDLDGDCDIELDDYALFLACMAASEADLVGGCACADFDLNGTVDYDDYLAFSIAVGQPVVGCRVRPPDACPDSWTTAGGGGGGVAGALQEDTFYDFGAYGPIPAGFFGEGSDPFGEIVAFVGTPADPSGLYGEVDTQIEHGPVVFDPETGIAQTTLDIITLDLMSKEPITVTYGGGNPEEWLVVAGLSPHYPGTGELTAALEVPGANSGTYDATVYVQPAFLFVKREDLVDGVLPECVAVRVLDTGEPADGGLSAGYGSISGASTVMPPIELGFTGQPFVREADPTIVEQLAVPDCAQGNFVPGVMELGGTVAGAGQQLTCTSHETPGEAHYFCPPECEGEDVCKYSATGSPTPVGPCTNLPSFPQAVLGQSCPNGVSQCRAQVVKHKPCPGGGSAFQTYANPACVSRESTCKGACCNDQGNCVLSSAALCDGTYMGDDTRCDSITCPKGACCHGDGTCDEKAPTACNGANDSYQGDGSLCSTFEPTITQQPEDTTVCVGGDAESTITATAGSGTLHYQWKKNGNDIAGETDSTLTLSNVEASDNGAQITCEVKDDCDTVTSDPPATLTVVEIKLKSVDFLGTGNHTLRKEGADTWTNDKLGDSGDVTINYEEWEDTDLDGTPDTQEPVCYTVGSNPVMNAVFALDPQLPAGTTAPAKLRVEHGGDVICTQDMVLSGATVSVTGLTWATAHTVGDVLDKSAYTLTWTVSLDDGTTYCPVATSETLVFVVLGTPIQTNSFGSSNALTCKRVDEGLENSGATSDVGTMASNLQRWRDDYGIDNTGATTGADGDKLWALLDGVGKGQCAEGSLVMEQAVRLLGISAEYQHVLPAVSLPVPVHSAASPASAPTRPHDGTTETLYLYFTAAGDFTGWNVGEGCCLVDGKLYAAWAGYMVGETGGTVDGKVAASAAHHILLQLEDGMPDLQRWRKANGDPCDSGDTVPVP